MNYKYISKRLRYEHESGKLYWTDVVNRRYKNQEAGCLHDGYITIRVNGNHYGAHRLAWLLYYGKWPNRELDHIDGNRSNNRITNLREVTSSQNSKNRSMSRANWSGHTGVSLDWSGRRWQAQICVDYVNYHLGYYNTKEDAAEAYERAKINFGFTDRHGEQLTNCGYEFDRNYDTLSDNVFRIMHAPKGFFVYHKGSKRSLRFDWYPDAIRWIEKKSRQGDLLVHGRG